MEDYEYKYSHNVAHFERTLSAGSNFSIVFIKQKARDSDSLSFLYSTTLEKKNTQFQNLRQVKICRHDSLFPKRTGPSLLNEVRDTSQHAE